jgi:pseudouridine-5'-phosphate glycosidase
MIDIRSVVEDAHRQSVPVVALESTLIAHGLPWPFNWETAQAADKVIREHGVVPAVVGVVAGVPTVGLADEEIRHLAQSPPGHIRKASRRDLAAAVVQGKWAATTVSSTMALAHRAGVRVFATGGIGGVHPGQPLDVSADLLELSRTPVAVVSTGAKSILDLPATLEALETLGVPVIGFRTDTFPAFYIASSGLPVSARLDDVYHVAKLLKIHWEMGGGGVLIVQPVKDGLDANELEQYQHAAEQAATRAGIRGADRTPYLLAQLAEATGGESLRVNQRLIVANADLAARIAQSLVEVS